MVKSPLVVNKMAFGATLNKRGVIGDLLYKIYDVTDVQSDGSSVIHTGFKKISA